MEKLLLTASISLASILVLSQAASGQTIKSSSKPDLSGSWLLDTKKSNNAGLTSRPDVPITIKHQAKRESSTASRVFDFLLRLRSVLSTI
jgi:hypothetical protein